MRLMARAGLAFALAALLGGGAAEAGLIVRERSNGLPGRSTSEVVPHTLLVGEKALRLQDRDGGRYTIVQVERQKIFEVDPQLQQYTEQDFAYLRRERQKADADREDARKMILERLSGAEQAQELAKRHLRADGKRVVTVESVPGDKIMGYHTRLISIFENGGRVLAANVTDEIKEYEPPKVIFDFWERSGLFSDEIVAEMKKIQGFPLRLDVEVDFNGKVLELQSQVEDVRDWPEDPRVFEVPAKCVKVDEFAREQAPAEKITCAVCGKELAPGKAIRVPGETNVWVCSDDDLREYKLKHKNR
jgi:hypothetical protein